MTLKRRRLYGLLFLVVVLGATAALVLKAFEDSVVFFFSPTDVATRLDLPRGKTVRIGGLVKEGSVYQGAEGSRISFVVTDLQHDIQVSYQGILPDLFREGQGVVAEGRLVGKDRFVAEGVAGET